MPNSHHPCLYICVWLMSAFVALPAQERTAPRPERVYQFDQKQLENLRQDPDYQYENVSAEPSLWQQFRAWLRELILGSMDSEQKQNAWSWIFAIFAGMVLLYVIIRLSGSDIQKLFRSGKTAARPSVLLTDELENWQVADFEQKINQALIQGDFDLAIRWLYLKTLKALDEKKLIKWQKDKTNQTYVKELSKTDFGQDFQEMTHWFEYVHYGDFKLFEADFKIIQKEFDVFFDKISAVHAK